MMINDQSKRVIPFRPHDAKRVGEGCYYIDQIVWLNGDRIELGDRVGFNYGCYVNGYGGLIIDDGAIIGPGVMIHTANHKSADLDRPISGQGWIEGPVTVGRNCWVGMAVCILPGVHIGEGCIVGAGSVVVSDLEDYSVSVGNPAKVIKSRR
ncbi:MAG: acyltransferase [Actinomycetota bacterium]|nr:acyltransferase [Actinomycetota bacterium]